MKQRIITGIIAGAVFLAMLTLGGYWFGALILLLAVVGYDEFMRMNHLKEYKLTYAAGLVLLLLLVIPWPSLGLPWSTFSVPFLWVSLFILLAITVISKNSVTIDKAALLFMGLLYLGAGFYHMIVVRLAEHGLFWTFLVFACIWASDSGAYFVGSKIGKHPLWPSISPNKSIEGSIGGIVLAVIVALVFAFFQPHLISLGRALELGAVIAIVGQLGDLMQSAYKRVKGIKDTGTVLPGHGGVLDRVDSWLIVFPFVYQVLSVANS